MSPEVNLDLEDVPFAILEVVKARILANRRRLGLSQEQTKPRPSTRPRAQFRKTGASSRGWRKPQHGAGVLDGERRFGVVSWYTNLSEGNRFWRWDVACGNFSKSLSGSTGFLQGINQGFPSIRELVLPVAGENCIFVYTLRRRDFAYNTAFAVSLDNIRQINVPAALASCISNYYASDDGPDWQFGEAGVGFADPRFRNEFSPVIFEILNYYLSFGPPIKQFPSGKNLAYRDRRQGLFGGYADDPRFYFAEWTGTSEDFDESDGSRLLPQPDLTIDAPNFFNKAESLKLQFQEESSYDFIAFWDWDDPDYCRAMCLALGFSEADLTP
jgi:hypothetical protein